MTEILLTIKNRGGSVQHYYHFLLGFLLPLAIKVEEFNRDSSITSVLVRSCGPMDRHIKALNFSKVQIIDAEKYRTLCQDTLECRDSRYLQHAISGFDNVRGEYEIDEINKGVKIIKKIIFDNIEELLPIKNDPIYRNNRHIVLIKRDKDGFYSSSESEIRGSGSDRRSISNFDELQASIKMQGGNLTIAILENATLQDQIIMFSGADIIIAQHGAALANLVWLSPRTKVIEIAPKLGPEVTNCFSSLSLQLGLVYQRVMQDGSHGSCDIAALGQLLADDNTSW